MGEDYKKYLIRVEHNKYYMYMLSRKGFIWADRNDSNLFEID